MAGYVWNGTQCLQNNVSSPVKSAKVPPVFVVKSSNQKSSSAIKKEEHETATARSFVSTEKNIASSTLPKIQTQNIVQKIWQKFLSWFKK